MKSSIMSTLRARTFLLAIASVIVATSEQSQSANYASSSQDTTRARISNRQLGGEFSSSSGIPKSQDVPSSAPIVRTYEKIALDDSEVRLVCPHVVAPINVLKASSFATVPAMPNNRHQHASRQQQQQQLASYREKTKKDTPRLLDSHLVSIGSVAGYYGHEQIRWFRNHVPLRRRNKAPHKPQIETEQPTKPLAHDSIQKHRFPPDNSETVSIAHPKHDTDSIKLNQTTGLMQDERGMVDRNERSTAVDDRLQPVGRKLQAERASVHHQAVAQTNVNEPSQDEQFEMFNSRQSAASTEEETIPEQDIYQDGASDEPEWHISDFGELVLSRVGSHSSGSYTCLYDGQLSEVLLDVLSDENFGPKVSTSVKSFGSSSSKWTVDHNEKDRKMTSSEALISDDSSLFKLEQKVSKISNDDSVGGLGSVGSIEGFESESGRIATGSKGMDSKMNRLKRLEINTESNNMDKNIRPEIGEAKLSRRLLLESSQARANGVRGQRVLNATIERPLDRDLVAFQGQSFMTPSFLTEHDQTRKDNLNPDTIQKNDLKNNVEFGEQTNSIKKNPFQATTYRSSQKQSKWIHLNTFGHRPQSQPRPHVVENEIISSRDLESIPGLVYTKQQFYCPLMSQANLFSAIQGRINLLIEKFCRPQEADRIEVGQELECAKLANRLIDQLIEISENSSTNVDRDKKKRDVQNDGQQSHKSNFYCFSSNKGSEQLVDIIWYKDGTKLNFDSDGRGLDKKLNVKLIDSIDRFETPSNRTNNKASENSTLKKQIKMFSSSEVDQNGGQQQEQLHNRTQPKRTKKILCPPKGLILEIDGIRRLNAGHYTCALRFNNSRLRSSLRKLKRLQLSSWLQNPGDKSGIGVSCSVCKNDKSKCCDADGKDRTGLHLLPMGPEMDGAPEIGGSQTKISSSGTAASKGTAQATFVRDSIHFVDENKSNSPIRFFDRSTMEATTTMEKSTFRDGSTLSYNSNNNIEKDSAENGEVSPNNIEHPFIPKQIKTLRSILNGSSFSNEEQWSYLERTILSPQPLMMVQTFLLLITERPANSCSLWSTIREANDAYSRRKLTDFKRLKRSLMKPIGSTIDENDGPPTWHQTTRARLENSNRSSGAHLIGHYPIKSADQGEHSDIEDDHRHGEDSVVVVGASATEAIHPNGNGRIGGNIDGKLVASLSWLNGAVESETGAIVEDAARQKRSNDDIDNARRRLEPSGQQNSFTSNGSDDDGGNHDDNNDDDQADGQQRVLAGANEVQFSTVVEDKIRHPPGGSFSLSASADMRTNGSLEFHDASTNASPQFSEAGNISIERDIEPEGLAVGRQQSTMLTNNASKQTTSEHKGVRRDPSWPQTSENNVIRDARNPFNYANEHSTMRNLNPHSGATLDNGSKRQKRAQTIVESFDLHLKTFDPGQIEQSSNSENDGLESETKHGWTFQVDTPGFDDRTQHSDDGRQYQSQRIDMKHAFSRQERRLARNDVVGQSLQLPTEKAGLIDNSDGSINTLAKYVIDGNPETSQVAANGDSEDEDDESSESDEAPNEADTVNLKPSVRGGKAQVGLASQLEEGKLFDSLDDDQTNSLPTTTTTKSSRSFDRISAGEFVTEKSNNIQTDERMVATPRRRRGKFNNIGTVRVVPASWTADASELATVSGRFGSDNFINFSQAQRRHNEKEKLHQWPPARPRPRRRRQQQQRILDDQSKRRERREALDWDDTDFGTHDNDDALSIGHAVSRRQPYDESRPEIGHKLQPSRTEQRRRLSRSDKSAWSVGGGGGGGDDDRTTSDPLWRHPSRLASDQPDDKIPSAISEVVPVTVEEEGSLAASSNSGKLASVTKDSIQYESTARLSGQHDDELEKSLSLPTAIAGTHSMAQEENDEIATSPGATQKLAMSASVGQQTSLTANGAPSDYYSNVSKDDDDDSIRGYSPSSISNSGGTENDESLLWAASQYLYMHIRAFAASSLYGVQVDVEWSNENEWTGINRTIGVSNDDGGDQVVQTVSNGDMPPRVDFNVSESVVTNEQQDSDSFGHVKASSKAPIATIELVSGQDLHLECTAQALGRLPEVNWYKRIDRIPNYIPSQMHKQLVRSLGNNDYWPVTSLDLLDYEQFSSLRPGTTNFVCSQSVTIFDNLLNQTFTVVNSLKLSDNRSDRKASLGASAQNKAGVGQPIKDWHHHIYACLVKADVRHEYATLGVNVRHASVKLPPGLSNRIRARPMSELAPVDAKIGGNKARVKQPQIIDIAVDIHREEPNYDFLRQSQFIVPFGGVWVPIRKNGTHLEGEDDLASSLYGGTKYSINPIMLSIVIASLSSLLVALIYFTMRSYRALTNYHLEDECMDCTNKQHLSDEQLESLNDDERYVRSDNVEFTLALKPASSYCKYDPGKMSFEHKLKEMDDDDNLDCQFVGTEQQPAMQFHPTRDSKVGTSNNIGKLESHNPFYEAHFHDSRFICDDEISTLLLSDMMSTEIKSELEYTFINGSTINNF